VYTSIYTPSPYSNFCIIYKFKKNIILKSRSYAQGYQLILIFLRPTTSYQFQFSQHISISHHLMSYSLKNISENSSSISHHLMSCNISPLKNNTIYLYFYNPLQVIDFNFLNMQVCHIISCHVILFHWKIFLKIKRACHITLCHIIFLHWEIILKNQENHFMTRHLSSLKT
jgi:hypothetical protein